MRFAIATIAGAGLLLSVCPVALAQEKVVPKATKPAAPAKPSTPAAAPAQPPQVVMPDAEKIVLLLRSTLNTLNDALQTGNFTVLREKSAPGFRQVNTAARLSRRSRILLPKASIFRS